MKVLVVSPRATAGGAETLLAQAVRGLAAPERPWHVVFFESGPLEAELRLVPGVSTEVVEAGRLRQPSRYWATVRHLRKRLLEGRFDRAVAWMPKAQLYLGVACRNTGIPLLWWQHGIPDPPHGIDRVASALAAASVLCPSEVSAQAQARLTRTPVRVVWPGIPEPQPDRTQAATLRSELLGMSPERERAPGADDVLAIAVCRIQPSKGLHVLVDAAIALSERFPGLVWAIVGGARAEDAAYQQHLIARLSAPGSPRVHWLGERSDVATLLAAADVLVHPSLGESFGLAVAEAMAAGLPVVATDCGGTRDLVVDGETGYLVPTCDPVALADAVARMLGGPTQRLAMGAAGQKRQQERFGLDSFLQALQRALEVSSSTHGLRAAEPVR